MNKTLGEQAAPSILCYLYGGPMQTHEKTVAQIIDTLDAQRTQEGDESESASSPIGWERVADNLLRHKTELQRQLDVAQRTPCEKLAERLEWRIEMREYHDLRRSAKMGTQAALRILITELRACGAQVSMKLCEAHEVGYRLAPPNKCAICTFVEAEAAYQEGRALDDLGKEGDALCHVQMQCETSPKKRQGSGEPESSTPPVAQTPANAGSEVPKK